MITAPGAFLTQLSRQRREQPPAPAGPVARWQVLLPLSLSTGGAQLAVSTLCCAALCVLFIADFKIPGPVTVSALGVVPVVSSAWLLSSRRLAVVVLLGVGGQVVLVQLGAISWLSAGAAISTFVAVALVVRLVALGYAAVLAMRTELQLLAVERARQRIRQDLHDGAIQTIFAVGMGLQGLARTAHEPSLQYRLQTEAAALDGVIDDLRNCIAGLAPGTAGESSLGSALTRVAETFERTSGARCRVAIDAGVESALTPMTGDLVHIVNEALSNAGRHGHASEVSVAVRRVGTGAVLEVVDNGRGFDPGTVMTGNGLRNFFERAEALGGGFVVDSGPDRGTVVSVRLPLRQRRIEVLTG